MHENPIRNYRPGELVVSTENGCWRVGRIKRLIPNSPNTYEVYFECVERTEPVWAKYLHSVSNDYELGETELAGIQSKEKIKLDKLYILRRGNWFRICRVIEKVEKDRYRVRITKEGSIVVSGQRLAEIANLDDLPQI